MFHVAFHNELDLPEALTAGREAIYLQHFCDRLGVRPDAVDTEFYARAFSRAGAMRAGFDLYRSFEQDASDNQASLTSAGKLQIPVLAMHGEISAFSDYISGMGDELAQNVTVEQIPGTGHWMAEENPAALAETLIRFDRTGH